MEVELWGGVQGGEDTKLILASGHSPCSGQARLGRPFWGSSFNNIFFFSDMNNPFCNPFSDSTHLSLVKSRIYSEEGLTSSQHASLLSLESLLPQVAKHKSVYFQQKTSIPRCQCVPQLFTFSSILFGNDAVVLGSIPGLTTAISREVA